MVINLGVMTLPHFTKYCEHTPGCRGGNGLMDKVSASQPQDSWFEPHIGHDHDSSYETSTGWVQETDLRVINISC